MSDPEGTQPRPLILASTSRYRAALLRRLGLEFVQSGASIDETAANEESPRQLATRLARQKSENVAVRYPDATVIGSDQVASADGTILGKPVTRMAAARQLAGCSGRKVHFFTAVCVCNPTPLGIQQYVDETIVAFRKLSDGEIERYVEREPALDCAGSFKAEGLGITLFDEIATRDPTALIGLPLIWVARALRESGFRLP